MPSDLREVPNGTPIRITTLGELVDRFSIKDGVLKLDCEGCEYEGLMGTSPETLHHFSEIILEYHYGAGALVRRLEKAGFVARVIHQDLAYYYQKDAANPWLEKGYIIATQPSEPQ